MPDRYHSPSFSARARLSLIQFVRDIAEPHPKDSAAGEKMNKTESLVREAFFFLVFDLYTFRLLKLETMQCLFKLL